jgi:hypothetical protein
MKTLKTAILGCALALVAFSSSTAAAPQNRKLDFKLVNKSTYVIVELYVAPSSQDEWGEDVLGTDVLPNNESVDIEFERSETTCNWDLKIVDEDEDEVTWTKLNLCTANEITLRYENGKPVATIK